MAKSEGWYESRRMVQGVFVVVMALLGMLIIAASYWYVHAAWRRRYRIAFFGAFIWLRSSSFARPRFITSTCSSSGVGGLYFNHILELGGIVFIGYAAWNATRQLPRQPHKAFEKTVRIR